MRILVWRKCDLQIFLSTSPPLSSAAFRPVNLLPVTSASPKATSAHTHSTRPSFNAQTFTLPVSSTETEPQAFEPVLTKETCTKQVPDVLELCVGGTHRYTTLLVTMTQAKAGDLAEMFLGKVPLHLMTDGSFFLDTDGESFQLIIEYLRDGRLPDMDVDSTKGRCEDLLLKSFQTARKYGLHEYLHDLDQYVHIQRFKELEANRDIVEFYVKQILWALNKNDLERNGKFAILLKSTNSTVKSAACCEHACQFATHDTVVHLTRDLSLRILSLLCQRFRCLGYKVTTNEESCVFRCSTHEEGDDARKECTSRRHLLTWFCRN